MFFTINILGNQSPTFQWVLSLLFSFLQLHAQRKISAEGDAKSEVFEWSQRSPNKKERVAIEGSTLAATDKSDYGANPPTPELSVRLGHLMDSEGAAGAVWSYIPGYNKPARRVSRRVS